jgi:hypothetical protein
MYACSLETGCGFFGGVCATGHRLLFSCDPPPTASRFANRHPRMSFAAKDERRRRHLPRSCGQAYVKMLGHKLINVVVSRSGPCPPAHSARTSTGGDHDLEVVHQSAL